MKTTSPALQALIFSGQFFDVTHYTITLKNGTVLRYAAADFNIYVPLFGPSTPYVGTWYGDNTVPLVDPEDSQGSNAHWKIGLDVDQWSLTVMPREIDVLTGTPWPDTISGVPWLAAAANGLLDGAQILVFRSYFAAPPQQPIPVVGAQPVGKLVIFSGIVGSVEVEPDRVILTADDMRSLLNVQMPRLLYQAGCNHILFDSYCGLSEAAYRKTGTVAAGSTSSLIIGAVAAPGGSGTYAFGKLQFTSGQNAGLLRMVKAWDGASRFSMFMPFPSPPSVGDNFRVWPGCDKTQATCNLFGNILNYGGTPFVPVPETTL